MKPLLQSIQIISSLLIIIFVLLQHKGGGLGEIFGGGAPMAFHTKRGFEKVIFNMTIVLIVILVLSTLLRISLVF